MSQSDNPFARLILRRSAGAGLHGEDYLVATNGDGTVEYCGCYVEPGIEAVASIEEGAIVVIRASDGTLLAEGHPPRR